jgi:curved DNA-binding protein CbpA
MRLSEVITGSMTYDQAVNIFSQLGIDPTGMDASALNQSRKRLIMKHHPDRGGSPGIAQNINAAYDMLIKGPQRNYRQDTNTGSNPSGQWYSGNRGRWEDEYEQPQQQDDDRYPIWAQAGWSGGMKENGKIYRNNYTDMNFIKKSMWELSGKSTTEFTIEGFDGHFFRNTLTVFGSPQIFNYMAQAMIDWQTKGGNPYQCRAVFVHPRRSKELLLIYADGKFYGDNPIPMEHESFNLNPSNDQQFVRKLPEILDHLASSNL